MSRHIRTTVRLPGALLARARKKARDRGATLTQLIEEGLLAVVNDKRGSVKRVRPPISTVRGAELIDITRSADVQDLLDEEALREGGVNKLR